MQRLTVLVAAAAAMGAAHAGDSPAESKFAYQGRLSLDGVVVDEPSDFRFRLWTAADDGEQIGDLLTAFNVPVDDGVFTVDLDFGDDAFTGKARWLEISVRLNDVGGAYSTLEPRQPLYAAPYSLWAINSPFNVLKGDGDSVTLAGNLGIGTLIPMLPLDVVGSARVQESADGSGGSVIIDGSGAIALSDATSTTVELDAGSGTVTAESLVATSGGVEFPDATVQTTAALFYSAGSGLTLTGTTFSIPSGAIGSSEVIDNALTANDLAADSVGASEIAAGAVGSSEVADNSLTSADLADNSVGSGEIADGAVGSSEVANNSLTANDLAAGSVGSSEVADNSLTAGDLASNSVGSAEIASSAVGSSEIADGAVGSSEVANNSLTASDLAAGSVGSSEVADNSLIASDLAANSVGASEIATGAVGSDEIADDAVGSAKVANNSLTAADLAAGSVGASEIASNAVASGDLASDAASLGKVSGNLLQVNGSSVGIGTGGPDAKLDIAAAGDGAKVLRFSTERAWEFVQQDSGGDSMLVLRDTVGSKRFQIQHPGGAVMAEFNTANDANFRRVELVPGGGRVSINGPFNVAFPLYVNGAAGKPGGGSWEDSSDRRLKTNIQPLLGSLDRLLALSGVTFEWREPCKHGNMTGPQIGMIAQEVEQVFPEWVRNGPDGFKILGFRGFEALTVEALRELREEKDAEIEALRETNRNLESRLVALEAMVAELATTSRHEEQNND